MRIIGLSIATALLVTGCSCAERHEAAADSATHAGPAAAVLGLTRFASADSLEDRDRWDPDALTAALGRDPDGIARWVRLNTQWIPYRGILRGPVGVLNDRLGNGIDRALLLATLLQRAGHTVRLAHAQLPLAQVVSLLPKLGATQVVRAEGQVRYEHDAESVKDIADAAGPDGEAAGRALQAAAESLGRAAAELSRRTDDQTARLLKAIPRDGSTARRSPWYAAAPAALADHWWVQRQEGSAWVDVDLLAEGSGRLVPAGAPVETLELSAVADASLYQEIGVRVVAEYRAGRALHEKRIIDYAIRPADVLGEPIALQFWPSRWLGDSAARADLDRNPAKNLPDEHEFGAMLVVGTRTVAAGGFRDTGESASEKAAAEAGPMGGLAGAFSQSMGDTPERASDLTAVWLEYEFRVPGEPSRTVRREVFDLIGPAARASGAIPTAPIDSAQRRVRALALVMGTELLPVNCRLSNAFVNRLASDALRGNAELFARAASGTPPTVAEIAALTAHSSAMPSPLLTLALARLAWSPNARDIYVDRAGLLTRHVYATVMGDRGRFIDAVDIVANDVGVGPMVRDAFAVRVAQGVFDTNAEALLWSGRGIGNAGDAYAASNSWRAVAAGDAGAIERLPASADVRQRLHGDVAAGRVVVAPTAEVRVGGEPFAGWWRVDPAGGTTLGMGANGWGLQATAEYSAKTRGSITWSQYFIELARVAGPNFTKAFGQQMVLCMAMTAGQDASAGKFATLGIKGEAAHGVRECTGDAIVIAGLATLPLFAITLNEMAAIRAARLARLAGATTPKLTGPKNPQGEPTPKLPPSEPNSDPAFNKTAPDLGETQPDLRQTQPDLGKTGQDLGKTGQDLGKTGQDLGKTGQDLGKTGQDLGKTGQDLGKTGQDLGKTGQDMGKTQSKDPAPEKSPAANTIPPGQSPYASTNPGTEPVEPQASSGKPGPEPPANEPEPLDRTKLTPVRQQLLDLEQQLIELHVEANQRIGEVQQAAGDYVRYEVNSPEHEGRYGADPSKYDPAVSQQLLDRYNAADAAAVRATNAFESQLSAVNKVRRSLQAVPISEGQVPTTPQQNFIGCPPNCWRLSDY